MKKVGIQGTRGSFCEVAAKRYFENKPIQCVYLLNSKNVCRELKSDTLDYGIIAVENSIGGQVKETQEALALYPCEIVGEVTIHIHQCLLTKKNIAFEEITEVHSHPQALKQSQQFLQSYLPQAKLVPEEDTAICAERLSQGAWPDTAAVIANEACAELYHLHLAKKSIQSNPNNRTRFFVVK